MTIVEDQGKAGPSGPRRNSKHRIMAFIPKDAKWYLAEILELITVEGDPRSVLHTNLVLIRANSPDEAYERAMESGRDGESSYENPADKLVQIKFLGLQNLYVTYEDLEHGAELLYTEEIGLSDNEIQERVRKKDELAVFQPVEPSSAPNYTSKEIVRKAYDLMAKRFSGSDDK